jgi:CheY-like chemotaxis protein
MQHPDDAIAVLTSMKRLGIRISIDDFGTGYSSLSYLKRFPLDALKIDRSFVCEVTENADDAAITRAVVNMAHSLNLKVIAEGVETEEQREFLCRINCELMQGYLFSKPLSPDDCAALLVADKPLRKHAKILKVVREPVILLVDDDPEALFLLEELLRPDGYRILKAADATQALKVLANETVSLIVSDQNMPGMSGIELLRRIMVLHPEVTRMLMTASEDLKVVAPAINEGVIFKYFIKHRDNAVLLQGVRQALLQTKQSLTKTN